MKRKKKSLNKIINTRYKYILICLILVMSFFSIYLFKLQIIDKDKYVAYVEENSVNLIEGDTAPRGKIYDRNHKIIVDNKAVKKIVYKKNNQISQDEEVKLAQKVADLIEINYDNVTVDSLKQYYLLTNKKIAKEKITKKEYKLLEERKLKNSDIEEYKLKRITDEELQTVNKEAAYIYYLMNNGYSYDEKTIYYDIDEEQYAIIAENLDSLPGFLTKVDWERYYPYGDTFKTILGTISDGLPYELSEHYLSIGYSYDDRVGSSYIEYQYEDILKGEKNKYKLNNDGTYELVEEGKRGNDIVLTIDIELQQQIEQILIEQVVEGKKMLPESYYNRSFVVIEDPNTGEILAMSGKQVVVDNGIYKIYDYTPGVFTTPVVPGSIVKGASHIVGYNNNALTIGEVRYDQCLKIASTKEKCSYRNLGNVNDIEALAKSSNVYQFYTAINVGKGIYKYNSPLVIDESSFDIYRNTFAQFGLGVLTGIDLENESTGYKGTKREPGLLMDFAIGQYDNYTPLQLTQYMSTIATGGKRYKVHLLKSVYEPTDNPLTKLKYNVESELLNTVDTKEEYMNRVKEGLRSVITSGTGYYYVDQSLNAAGKTGTSESFIDTDNDGMIDTQTVTNTFATYFPYDNPSVTISVVSPDVGYYVGEKSIQMSINQQISNLVSKKYFEIYK